MRDTPPRAYLFGGFRLDTISRQLLRDDGKPLPLTAKVFETLLYLVERPGQALGKDQLMAALWPGRVVEENNLNQKISTLRRVLGASGSADRYIATEPGHGYRFVAEVRVETDAFFAAPHADSAQQHAPSTPQAADDVRTPLPPMAMALPTQRSAVAAQARRWLLPALVLLLAIAAWQALEQLRPSRSADIAGAGAAATDKPAAVTHALLVLPLRMIGGVADDTAFAEGLGEELISVLARVDGLRVIARDSAFRVHRDDEDLVTVARRLGVTHTLEGSMRHEGDQLRVSLRLTDLASGRTLWAEQYDHAARDVFALERDVALAVSAALALKLSAQVQAELAREGDPVLYRRYLEARRLGRNAPRKEGIDAFRQLIADAPDYARAHGGLALVLLRSGMPRKAEAIREAERALALDPGLTDANAALGFAACQSDDWERGVRLNLRALEQAPGDTAIRLGYGICLTALGYLPAGLAQIQSAQAADPLSDEANIVFGTVLDIAGRHDEAATYYARVADVSGLLWFNAMWRGNLAQARASMATQNGRWSASMLAVTDALEDPAKWPAARAQFVASENADGQPDGQRNWARMFDPQTDVALDIAALANVRHLGVGPQGLWLWTPAMAGHRQHPAFQDYLERTHTLDYWRLHGWPAQCRAAGDAARCE